MRNKILTIIILVVVLASGYLLFYFYTTSVDYNLKKIIYGDNDDKYKSMEILAKKDVKIAIPLIIREVDNYEKILYEGKTPEELNCIATNALGDLTGLQYGDSCCCEYGRERSKDSIINDWKNWYNKEYASWIVNNYK